MPVGPVERHPLPNRQERKRAEEPPEETVPQSPAEARAITAYVTLKQQAECGADDDSKHTVQGDTDLVRSRVHQTSNKREEVDLRHPFAEGPAANDPGDPTHNQRPWPAKRDHPGL